MDVSNKDVGLDNVNAGDGEKKVDPGEVYNGGGDSNDDVGVDDVGKVNTNCGEYFDKEDRNIHINGPKAQTGSNLCSWLIFPQKKLIKK